MEFDLDGSFEWDGPFDWDDDKRRSNVAKHGIDFDDARALSAVEELSSQRVDRDGEIRIATTGVLIGRWVTAVWTPRDARVRIISVRSARDAERRKHRQLYG